MGYETTPYMPQDAYSTLDQLSEETKQQCQHWIIIGEISKIYPMFHVKKWSDIYTDINCSYPTHFNIRKVEEGIQVKTCKQYNEGGKSFGSNNHCLIEFTKADSDSEVDFNKHSDKYYNALAIHREDR